MHPDVRRVTRLNLTVTRYHQKQIAIRPWKTPEEVGVDHMCITRDTIHESTCRVGNMTIGLKICTIFVCVVCAMVVLNVHTCYEWSICSCTCDTYVQCLHTICMLTYRYNLLDGSSGWARWSTPMISRAPAMSWLRYPPAHHPFDRLHRSKSLSILGWNVP